MAKGLKWCELAIGLAMASGGETVTKEGKQWSGGPIVKLEPEFKTIQVWSKI